VNYNWN
jgi:hypothetical protein